MTEAVQTQGIAPATNGGPPSRSRSDPAALKKRWERMDASQQVWRDLWQELSDYLLPRKSNITKMLVAGQKQTEKLFDSVGVRAPELLAASLAGTLTSPAQQWFGLTARDEHLNKQKRVRDWLEDTTKRTYLALNNSNFNSEISEVFLDIAVFGTGAMLIEERQPLALGKWGGMRFRALTIGEYVIDEGPDQRVDTLFRKFKLSARNCKTLWGSMIPDSIARDVDAKPESQHEILHAVYPRDDYQPAQANPTTLRKRYASCYLTFKEAKLLAESGFDEFPYVVPRWAKTSGEQYGRGPGYTALPDIRTANRLRELELAAGAKAVDPPLMAVDDGVVGSITLEPAAINTVREKGALEPLVSGSNWQVAEWLDTKLGESIREIFFTHITMLMRDPQMTATQFLGLLEEMWRLLGPTAGRLLYEMFIPLLERAINIQFRAGVLLPPPPELLQGADIDIQFEGPLARAQKSRDLTAIERKNAYLQTVLPVHPEVGDIFDWDREATLYSEVAGVPSDLLRDPELVKQMREARLQAKQAQQKLQLLAESAKPIKELAQGAKAASEAGVDIGQGSQVAQP